MGSVVKLLDQFSDLCSSTPPYRCSTWLVRDMGTGVGGGARAERASGHRWYRGSDASPDRSRLEKGRVLRVSRPYEVLHTVGTMESTMDAKNVLVCLKHAVSPSYGVLLPYDTKSRKPLLFGFLICIHRRRKKSLYGQSVRGSVACKLGSIGPF